MLSPRTPSWIPSIGSHSAAPLSLVWSLQGKAPPFWWPPCTAVAPQRHFPSCCLIFQNVSVPTQLGFFSSQIRSGFSYCNARFPWVRNYDLYIHLFSPVVLLYFWTGMSVNPDINNPTDHHCITYSRFLSKVLILHLCSHWVRWTLPQRTHLSFAAFLN